MTNHTSMRDTVMKAIQEEAVTMRPRWHYILLSGMAATGVVVLFLMLLYVVSLGVFFLRESGVWFAPTFGARGWWELLNSLPMTLIVLLIVFTVLLEMVARRYSFVYRRPFLVSIVSILVVVMLGGILVEGTTIHHNLQIADRQHMLPPPMDGIYGHPSHFYRPPGLFRGTLLATTSNGFDALDIDGDGTTSIIMTPKTQLPDGDDFSIGDDVMVIGDMSGTDTIRAFGIHIVEKK